MGTTTDDDKQLQSLHYQAHDLERKDLLKEMTGKQAIQGKSRIQRLKKELNQAIGVREEQMGDLKQELKAKEQLIAVFRQRISKLEVQLRQNQGHVEYPASYNKDGNKGNIKLSWREGERAPCEMVRVSDAIVDKHTVYYVCHENIYGYHAPSSKWSPVQKCPIRGGFADYNWRI